MVHKRWLFMLASCTGMFCCFVIVLRYYYRYKANEYDFKLWDIKTITIDDYSVELKIDDDLY